MLVDIFYFACFLAALMFLTSLCTGCSSTSKVVRDTTQERHIEQKEDSLVHIARKDSIVNTNVSLEEWWKNVVDREYWNEVHDSTFVIINADGTTDTRTVRSTKEKEVKRDTIWCVRVRDSIYTEYVYVMDSVREKSYKSQIDSLTHELRDKEAVIKEMSFWDKLRQGITGGIICLFVAGFIWLYFKVIK